VRWSDEAAGRKLDRPRSAGDGPGQRGGLMESDVEEARGDETNLT
jgi:hypothetical protein